MLQAKCEFGYPEHKLGKIDYVFVPGVITCITGLQGSGKTSLLKTLAGVIAPLSGELTFQGKTLDVVKDQIQLIGTPVLDDKLTVEDHFNGLVESGDVSREDADKAIDTWLLEGFLDTRPDDLTIERTQRVYLALSLLTPGKVVLLDQPARDLEEEWYEIVVKELKGFAANGVTVIVASEDDVVMASAERTLDLGSPDTPTVVGI